MSFGSNYVSAPYGAQTYSTVAAYAVDGTNTIPSGATVVHGIYYMWSDQGFTGKGWMYEVGGGPTNMYPDFKSNDDVATYVATNGNLDAVFYNWSLNYTIEGWDAFYKTVGADSGCMDVDQA